MADNEIRTDVDTNVKVNTEGINKATKDINEFTNSVINLSRQLKDVNKSDNNALKRIIDSIDIIEEKYKEINNNIEVGGLDHYLDYAKAGGLSQYVDELNKNGDTIKDTKVNLDDLEDTLLSMAKSGNLSSASIEGLLGALGMAAPEIAAVVAALAIIKKSFDIYNETLKEVEKGTVTAIKYFEQFGRSLAGVELNIFKDTLLGVVDAVKGIATTINYSIGTIGNIFDDTFTTINNIVGETINKLQEFSEIGKDVQDSYFKIYEYLGADAGSNIINYTKNMSELTNTDFKEMITGMKGILAVTSQLGLDADGVTKYSKALNNMALDLSVFSGESVENIASQYENAINLGVLNSRSAIAKAFDLTDSDIKQFKSLNTELERTNFLLQRGESIQGLYNQYMDTASGKVNQLKNAWANFNSTVGQLALQLYAIVAPVLTKLVNLATYAVNVLAKLLHIDLGTSNNGLASAFSNNMADNVGRYADNVGKVGDSIKETGKKAKDASRKLASFDDVIQINEDKSSDSKTADLAAGLEDLQNYDPSSWLGEFGDAIDEVTDYSLPELKKMLKDLLNNFKNWEESLNWTKLRKEAKGLGKDLASLANIIARDNRAWKDFGNLIGNGLNLALEFLDDFAIEFDFKSLGNSIVTAWNEFWNTLDTGLTADTIANWIKGSIETALGVFEGRPITTLFDKLSRIIAGTFIRLADSDSLNNISSLIYNIIDDIKTGIDTALTNFDNFNTGEKILEVIRRVFYALGNGLPGLLESISSLITTGIAFIGDSIRTALGSFLDGIGTNPETIDRIINAVGSVIDTVFSEINKIQGFIQEHKDQLTALLQSAIQYIVENADDWTGSVFGLIRAALGVLRNIDWSQYSDDLAAFMQTLLDNLFGTALELEDLALKIGSTIVDALSKVEWSKYSDDIKTFFDNLFEWIGNNGDKIITTAGKIISAIFDGISKIDWATFSSDLVSIINNAITYISDHTDEWLKDIQPLVDAIIYALQNLDWVKIDEVVNKVMTDQKLGELITNLIIADMTKSFIINKNKFVSWLMSPIGEIIRALISGPSGIASLITTKIIGAIASGISSAASKNKAQGSYNGTYYTGTRTIYTPSYSGKRAIGGVVTRETLATVGEDGMEAILPLEKNTGWMDTLATKIAAIINSGGGSASAPVEIKLSNKNFYTRAEMLDFAEQVVQALRIYGVNVSVAY